MNLDILFIHANASGKIYKELSKYHSAIEPPIWAGMLANHCRNNNNKVDYIKRLNILKNVLSKKVEIKILYVLRNQSDFFISRYVESSQYFQNYILLTSLMYFMSSFLFFFLWGGLDVAISSFPYLCYIYNISFLYSPLRPRTTGE